MASIETLKRAIVYKDGVKVSEPIFLNPAQHSVVTLTQLMPEHTWTYEEIEIPNPNFKEETDTEKLAKACRYYLNKAKKLKARLDEVANANS